MPSPLDDLLERAGRIEREIEHELNHSRERWRYRIDWCPIRHAKRVRAPHPHYREFVDYGDATGYQQQLPLLRAKLKNEKTSEGP